MTNHRLSALAVVLALPIGACASTQIDCGSAPATPGSASAALECAAGRGDRQAMLAMGKRYEVGDGVDLDLTKARSLYARAAADLPSTMAIYSPPVHKGGYGQVIFIPNPESAGSAEAKYRLGRLYMNGAGGSRDEVAGMKLITAAAGLGLPEARAFLSER